MLRGDHCNVVGCRRRHRRTPDQRLGQHGARHQPGPHASGDRAHGTRRLGLPRRDRRVGQHAARRPAVDFVRAHRVRGPGRRVLQRDPPPARRPLRRRRDPTGRVHRHARRGRARARGGERGPLPFARPELLRRHDGGRPCGPHHLSELVGGAGVRLRARRDDGPGPRVLAPSRGRGAAARLPRSRRRTTSPGAASCRRGCDTATGRGGSGSRPYGASSTTRAWRASSSTPATPASAWRSRPSCANGRRTTP